MSGPKLVLGTAQLGGAYGVNNAVGELGEEAAFGVLDAAFECGVRALDTAEAYGKSQEVIGRYAAARPGRRFDVCTKLSSPVADPSGGELEERVARQLGILGCEDFFIYYLHDFAMCEDGRLLDGLAALRGRGLLRKVGVSLYEPWELERVLSAQLGYIDAVQVPLNVFNCHRWLGGGLLERAAEAGLAVLARSVYLQGLVFMDPDDPKVVRLGMSGHVRRFRGLADELGVGPGRLAADFVRSVPGVDYVLFGAETPGQVRENAAVFGSRTVWDDTMVAEQVAASSAIPDEAADPRFWNGD